MTARKNPRSATRTRKTTTDKRRKFIPKPEPAGKAKKSASSLRRDSKEAGITLRRAGVAYVEKATEFEAARIDAHAASRQLAAFYSAQAERTERPYFNYLAQGDSWFTYTCGHAIIHYLAAAFGTEHAYFDNVAASGRTLRQMQSREFKDHLAAGPPSGQPWNGILISGGGNDICGDHRFRDWLKPSDGGGHPADWSITSAFQDELHTLQGIYEEIVQLVRNSYKDARVFAHDYDFALPDGRCVEGRSPHLASSFHLCFAGPWMRPAFEERGVQKPGAPLSQLSKDIVILILKRFADMLAKLEQKYPGSFVLVRTQGTLQPIQDPKLWANELHPFDDGFKRLAEPFLKTLRQTLG